VYLILPFSPFTDSLSHILNLYSSTFVDCEVGMKSPDSKGNHRRNSLGQVTEGEKPKRVNVLQVFTGGLKKGVHIFRGGTGRRKHNRDWNRSKKYGSLPLGNALDAKVNILDSDVQSRYSCDKTILRDNFSREDEHSPLFPVHERQTLDQYEKEDDDDESVDHSVILAVEKILRYILIAFFIYWLGINHKLGSIRFLHQAAECLFVAWTTCVIILILTKFIKKQSTSISSISRTIMSPRKATDLYPVTHVPTPALDSEITTETRQKDADIEYAMDPTQDLDSTEVDTPILHHPELENLHLIDCTTFKRIFPNSGHVPIDNDYMYGVMVPMFRTRYWFLCISIHRFFLCAIRFC